MGTQTLDITNLLFVLLAHVLAAVAVAYMAWVWLSPLTLGLGIVWFVCCGLAITAGYHRLFSHRTYRAAAPVRLFYLLFGAAAAQNSALRWCADHRLHHARTDQSLDPYSIKDGFWWAHIGWVVFDRSKLTPQGVADLALDRYVSFQDRFYPVIAILVGAVVPMMIGSLWNDAIGALLVSGFLRLVVQWHATFCVNSLGHAVGTQRYTTAVSARDCWLTALITFGEGYHNFHHRFPADYRNGVRWYQFDPTKWFIWTLSQIGLAWNLKRVPPAAIAHALQTARAAS